MKVRTTTISVTLLAVTISTAAVAQRTAPPSQYKPSATVSRKSAQTGPKYADEATANAPETSPIAKAADTSQAVKAPESPQLTKAPETPQLVARPQESHSREPLLPNGTAIRVKLSQAISTRDAGRGTPFTATVTEAVVVNGKTVVPKGATLTGKIARVGEPRRIAGRPWVDLRPDTITTTDGHSIHIAAIAVDTNQPHKYTVNDEGRIAGPSYNKTTAMGTTALAGSGALTGALFAGPVGSLVGAGTGATIGTGHYYATHHSTTIPANLEVIFEITGHESDLIHIQ